LSLENIRAFPISLFNSSEQFSVDFEKMSIFVLVLFFYISMNVKENGEIEPMHFG
jgi:hypothetical protein